MPGRLGNLPQPTRCFRCARYSQHHRRRPTYHIIQYLDTVGTLPLRFCRDVQLAWPNLGQTRYRGEPTSGSNSHAVTTDANDSRNLCFRTRDSRSSKAVGRHRLSSSAVPHPAAARIDSNTSHRKGQLRVAFSICETGATGGRERINARSSARRGHRAGVTGTRTASHTSRS